MKYRRKDAEIDAIQISAAHQHDELRPDWLSAALKSGTVRAYADGSFEAGGAKLAKGDWIYQLASGEIRGFVGDKFLNVYEPVELPMSDSDVELCA